MYRSFVRYNERKRNTRNTRNRSPNSTCITGPTMDLGSWITRQIGGPLIKFDRDKSIYVTHHIQHIQHIQIPWI